MEDKIKKLDDGMLIDAFFKTKAAARNAAKKAQDGFKLPTEDRLKFALEHSKQITNLLAIEAEMKERFV
ncbi:MAG: hypothetical protein JAY75_23065 [Candidatus Thiodiazotropha taylori]|nr:hypothetical protein [Candidatus Thiodiazotropha taylori]MCG8095368.1 hypothetical protein [Candidatus Thiodiazotropha endolucinida]MCG7882922.1 hypothetical protein [Candidatus Thiodiazotropha taylori]MCG7888542.1 hypothetical protein [Candidatus Thiodiazotropha taylori]MCG7892264.1 hypothetical protein [Candidatus Thiodiazotropha taylori]